MDCRKAEREVPEANEEKTSLRHAEAMGLGEEVRYCSEGHKSQRNESGDIAQGREASLGGKACTGFLSETREDNYHRLANKRHVSYKP